MQNIYDYSLIELTNYFIKNNEKSYRAKQVYNWLYQQKVNSFFMMQNLKKEIIEKLETDFTMKNIKIIDKQQDNYVKKYLFKLFDDNYIEAVLLEQNYGLSLCVSTQVGCNMGCLFCQSAVTKKIRDLSVYEMVQQILVIEEKENIRISHVVVMGIGEPFDNYDNVMKFLNIINDPNGLAIGARHITVSTCGLVPRIYDFIEDGGQVNLAISLHAPNDKIRNQLVPINQAYPLNELMKSIREYIRKTNRRVTFEYVMLKEINDQTEHAEELSKLLKGLNCYVNLIPYNPTENNLYQSTNKEQILKFYDIMKKNKINITIRRELGKEIMAGCGQLRAKQEEE